MEGAQKRSQEAEEQMMRTKRELRKARRELEDARAGVEEYKEFPINRTNQRNVIDELRELCTSYEAGHILPFVSYYSLYRKRPPEGAHHMHSRTPPNDHPLGLRPLVVSLAC
eukprot:1186745-Prorocentrum_minimum.AAC.9